ncbi:MAG TPA: response regulator transcription factor [Bryobacteraceae bacterium]|nr:response regulator transcription factor [Bryobacteraceae bacterium]
MIRVVVAARSSVVRAGLESVVRSSSSLELAGAVDWALLASAEFEGDVMLLDAGDTLPELRSLPVVLLIDTTDATLVSAALRSGMLGVLSREATPEEIESAIQAVNAGLVVVTAGSLTALLSELRPAAEALAAPLSDRELEVLNLIAEGHSNKLIAHSLGISEHTVKTHVASIFAKLEAGSRTEAVSQAIRRGLVML